MDTFADEGLNSVVVYSQLQYLNIILHSIIRRNNRSRYRRCRALVHIVLGISRNYFGKKYLHHYSREIRVNSIDNNL